MAEPAVWQFFAGPRWLKSSGLPQALAASDWSVFREVVEQDHQTMGMAGRRTGENGCRFRLPQRDLSTATGFRRRTVSRSLGYLSGTKLLSHYRPGRGRQEGGGGSWCTFGVNTATLADLFTYVAPMLMRIHGGIFKVPHAELPPGGLQVYGVGDMAVVASWQRLYAISGQHQSQNPEPDKLQDPDPEMVAEICGL